MLFLLIIAKNCNALINCVLICEKNDIFHFNLIHSYELYELFLKFLRQNNTLAYSDNIF